MRFVIGMLAAMGIGLPASANTWETYSWVDPFTDAHVGVAELYGSTVDKGWLVLPCTDGRLQVIVGHEDRQLDEDEAVLSRVGVKPPKSQSWSGSTTGEWLFHPYPDNLLRDLREDPDHKFAVRVWTVQGRTLDSVFNLINLEQAMPVIQEAGC